MELIIIGRAIYAAAIVIYWVIAIGMLYLAWWLPTTPVRKSLWIVFVATVFGYFPVTNAYADWQARRYRDAAYAHFMKRCNEDAREEIYKVVENVEGIFIAKPRAEATDADLRNQYWMGDPYGYSPLEAKHPASTYLHRRSGKTVSQVMLTPIEGFRFVEMENPDYPNAQSAPYLRFTLKNVDFRNSYGETEKRVEAVAQPVNTLESEFGITWDDISTPLDRKYWVAGGTLTIFHIKTSQVAGRRVGYIFDPHLGRVVQGRTIWAHVNHIPGAFCPRFENAFDKNKEFVAKVLKAAGGRNYE